MIICIYLKNIKLKSMFFRPPPLPPAAYLCKWKMKAEICGFQA